MECADHTTFNIPDDNPSWRGSCMHLLDADTRNLRTLFDNFDIQGKLG
jgi:hypothetical protein